jgi:hypothetical protein
MTGVATTHQGLVTTWSDSALYYAIEENALLKCKVIEKEDGSKDYTWVQVNATSDIAADITALTSRVNTLEGQMTAVETFNSGVDGKIAAAKQAAIDAAAADATSKANTAESNAKKYVDNKLGSFAEGSTVESLLGTKVDQTAFETYQDIVTTALNGKASTSDLNTAKSDLTSAIATAKAEAINDADGKNTALKTELQDEISGKVDKTVFETYQESVGNTYATQTALATAKSDLTSAIATAKTEAINDADGKNTALKTELQGNIDKKVDTTTYEAKIEAIEKSISDNATAAGNVYATKTEVNKGLEDNATASNKYTDDAIAVLDENLSAEIDKKVDKTVYEAKVEELLEEISTGDSATLQ